jgi:hypothetical protein
MTTRTTPRRIATAVALLLAPVAVASTYDLLWHTVDSGGGTATAVDGSGWELEATIGQPDAGEMTGDGWTLAGGFLASEQIVRGACCIRTPEGSTCEETLPQDCTVETFVCDAAAYVPQTIAVCYADADANGAVNAGDRGVISANLGQTNPILVCRFDLDGNGVINAGDRGFVSANIGQCHPLPDFQDGSGMNGGVRDTRFGSTVFHGIGTSCETIACP